MSTSVLVNGIGLLEPPMWSGSSVPAGGSFCRHPPEPLPPVLHDHRGYHDRDEWPCGQAERDGIADLQRPAAAARGSGPAQLLLGEVHPERRDHNGKNKNKNPHPTQKTTAGGQGPLKAFKVG